MDLYGILEIKSNASEVEIKKAYHRLVKLYHPDKNKSPDANQKFQRIHSAYEILINDKSRAEYHRMNNTQKDGFIKYLDKIINLFKQGNTDEAVSEIIKETIDIKELNNYGITSQDIDYIQKNIMNFFKSINVKELFHLIKNGIVPKKQFNNVINCSESDMELYDELCAEYYYTLPISLQNINPCDIRLDLSIKLGDITNKCKRKIKIKRKINDILDTQTFIFDVTTPYVVFYGAGDIVGEDYGDLIIRLILPNNLIWDENVILIEQSMSLYEMIYGMDIKCDMGEDTFNIRWIASRDGFYVKIPSSCCEMAIKLCLNYEDTIEKEQMLRNYFS